MDLLPEEAGLARSARTLSAFVTHIAPFQACVREGSMPICMVEGVWCSHIDPPAARSHRNHQASLHSTEQNSPTIYRPSHLFRSQKRQTDDTQATNKHQLSMQQHEHEESSRDTMRDRYERAKTMGVRKQQLCFLGVQCSLYLDPPRKNKNRNSG